MTILNRITGCLSHADFELDRLIQQAHYWHDYSVGFLRNAGIAPGMRVLDVGSGAGDFAFLAAEMVGDSGSVVSVDSSPLAIARSVHRAAEMGFTNIKFVHRDIDSFDITNYGRTAPYMASFDAIIGRMVLMHLPAPGCTLQRLSTYVAPGGIVAFQEIDMSAAQAEPALPVFEQAMEWIRETYCQASIPLSLGRHLHDLYRAAGMPAPNMLLAGRGQVVTASAAVDPLFEYVANNVRTLLPLMERLAIATNNEVQIETLAQRLHQEATQREATIVPPTLMGAWVQL